MIFGSSPRKARRSDDPFDLSDRHVVESLHTLYQLEARTGAVRKRKLRRSQWGMRTLRWAGLVVSLISLTLFGKWAYQRAFLDNPDFRLKRVELIIPDGFRGTKILEVAKVEQGMKMMAIDLEGMRSRLAEIPLVSTVKVSREFPDKLLIEIEEARPLAWLSCPAQGIQPFHAETGWLIDEQGLLVKCGVVTPRLSTLPVIQLEDVYVSEKGEMMDSTMIQSALALMEDSRTALEGESLDITQITADTTYSLRVRYSNRMEVVYGLSNWDRSLEDLRMILARSRADGKLLATVNLMAKRNIPVTFHQPPVAKPVDMEADG